MTDDNQLQLLLYEKVVIVASSILGGQTELIDGSRILSLLSHKFDENWQDDFQLFALIDSDSDNLALGPERNYWNKAQLAKQDIEIENFITFYKDDVLNTCRDLIREIETEIVELSQSSN